MTVIQKFEFTDETWYRVWENGKVRYCTLEEVLFILSTKEGEYKWE